MTFFYRQMPELVERGHIYIAQPPLYKAKHGKQERYLKDDYELDQYLLQLALDRAELIPSEGAEPMSGEQLGAVARQFLLARAVIERESRVIDPMLQDAMLKVEALSLETEHGARETLEKLNAHIQAEDLELELMHDTKNDGWMIKIIRKLHGNVMVSVLDQDFLDSSDYQVLVKTSGLLRGLLGPGAAVRRGETVRPITEFAQALDWLLAEAKKGMAIQRYKGLGEMNAEQLWETTMDPTVRRLLKVRIEDAMGADDVFTTLMGDNVEPRRAFIESNALIARNIDI